LRFLLETTERRHGDQRQNNQEARHNSLLKFDGVPESNKLPIKLTTKGVRILEPQVRRACIVQPRQGSFFCLIYYNECGCNDKEFWTEKWGTEKFLWRD
jgi:hypothetical protein